MRTVVRLFQTTAGLEGIEKTGGGRMRMGLIACEVLRQELSAAMEPCGHTFFPVWMRQGLHDTPDLLRAQVQTEIARLEQAEPPLDAILLGYGLCGGGTAGLCAGNVPLVLPRTDDCIGILLGSQERYLSFFHSRSGIYWFSTGWLTFADTPSESYYAEKLRDYAARFGEEDARWLLAEENRWISQYQSGIYIRSPVGEDADFEQQAQEACAFCGWAFETTQGDNRLAGRLLSGRWDGRFLVCPPGCRVERDWDGGIFRAGGRQENEGDSKPEVVEVGQ